LTGIHTAAPSPLAPNTYAFPIDIKALTESSLVSKISPAITKYHETQFSTVKLPGSSGSVLVSAYNNLGNNRYYDSATNTAFDFDPLEQKASNAQSHSLDSQNADLIQKLNKALRAHADEHYPSATVGVFPAENDSKVALVLVSNKYSPNNFWYVCFIPISIAQEHIAKRKYTGTAVGAHTTSSLLRVPPSQEPSASMFTTTKTATYASKPPSPSPFPTPAMPFAKSQRSRRATRQKSIRLSQNSTRVPSRVCEDSFPSLVKRSSGRRLVVTE
jgi:hypothetical protein